jgi:hypothetical protein
MRLEDYFDFLGTDDIRVKGHRIGIDDVLSYYLGKVFLWPILLYSLLIET